MTSPLTKLISVAEAARVGPRGHYDEPTSFVAIHSPANMAKYHKAVEEVVKAVIACSKLGSYNDKHEFGYELNIDSEEAISSTHSALANFNKILAEITK